MANKPDILELIDYQIRMATNGSAPTLWFAHAIPALRQAQREIRRLRKLVGGLTADDVDYICKTVCDHVPATQELKDRMRWFEENVQSPASSSPAPDP